MITLFANYISFCDDEKKYFLRVAFTEPIYLNELLFGNFCRHFNLAPIRKLNAFFHFDILEFSETVIFHSSVN